MSGTALLGWLMLASWVAIVWLVVKIVREVRS